MIGAIFPQCHPKSSTRHIHQKTPQPFRKKETFPTKTFFYSKIHLIKWKSENNGSCGFVFLSHQCQKSFSIEQINWK